MSTDDLREKLAGLVRAERLLRDQEQHYAADSVADAITHMDRCLQKSERAEELGGSLADRIERALILTVNPSDGVRCDYGCGVQLIEQQARHVADALLPIIEAHTAAAVAEVRELIAGRLDAETDRATEHARVKLPFEFGLSEAYGQAARIVRGQA